MQVLAFIRKKEPVEQAVIIKHFFEEFDYKNLSSCRVAVGRILKNIESQGLASKKSQMNESSGSIDKNVWRTTK